MSRRPSSASPSAVKWKEGVLRAATGGSLPQNYPYGKRPPLLPPSGWTTLFRSCPPDFTKPKGGRERRHFLLLNFAFGSCCFFLFSFPFPGYITGPLPAGAPPWNVIFAQGRPLHGTMAGPATPSSPDSQNTIWSSTTLNHTDKDLEEEEEKICAVCGDQATGYHFHAMTCEGCKSFFRRTVLKGFQFTCPFTRSCTITKAKRRQCQACRFQKCLAVGMKKDMIMSEEALCARRELRRQKQQGEPNPPAQQTEKGSLTADQQELIEILSEAYKKNVDSSFSPFTYYQTQVRLSVHSPQEARFPPLFPLSSQEPVESYPDDVLPDVFSMLPLFADLTTFMIQQVIQFAKAIPYFRNLPVDDQISLLKGATMEICEIQFNMFFDLDTEAWVCGPHSYTVESGVLIGFKQIYLEPIRKFHVSLRKLNLHDAEYVLLQALVLFSPDDVTVTQQEAVDQIQERIALALKSYIDHCHPLPEGRSLYAKLLLLLTELRTLKVEGTRQIHHIHNREGLISMTPLLSEIIS
uniref:Nuclear receptor subfamily 1 group I member 3 n=1 Tax=Pogona vitticeps TaxID=103695 RepID=A0ABM5F3U2_9SAUR